MATSSTCQGTGESAGTGIKRSGSNSGLAICTLTMGNLKGQRNLFFTVPNLDISQMLEPKTDFRDTVEVPRSLPSRLLSAPHQQPMNKCY